MNKLFVAYKPPFLSSNGFLKKLKWQDKVKSAGFSGTLDPFAKGVLIIAYGKYAKLFRFLKKTPKRYKATLFLGANSPSMDIENVDLVEPVEKRSFEDVEKVISSLVGKQEQIPPKYSAKRINGKRAYEYAVKNIDLKLKAVPIEVFSSKLIHYCHPFITFEVEVSEGSYVRVLGQDIAQRLNTFGTLSALERTSEGMFTFNNQEPLNPLDYLDLPENFYLGEKDLNHGPKLFHKDLKFTENGFYYIKETGLIRIIEITDGKVIYTINSIEMKEIL